MRASSMRFGSVPYLNARPLLRGLEHETGPLTYAVPRELSRLLAEGDVDVALAPVVAGFEQPDLVLVPEGAVVAHGPVESVLLFAKCPPEELRTVALDRSSRTSAALTRVLCRFRWGTRPTYRLRDPDPDLRWLDDDAALLIGDPALVARWDGPEPIDLGAAWTEWTGLPFVFAGWFARTPELAAQASAPLRRAASRGREALDDIALEEGPRIGVNRDRARVYLREHLSFDFGERERAGLDRFHELWRTLRAEEETLGEDDPGR